MEVQILVIFTFPHLIGYVFCEYDSYTRQATFTRLYVEDYIVNVNDEVLGANVRYQSPFVPKVLNHGLNDFEWIIFYSTYQKSEQEIGYKYQLGAFYTVNEVYIPNICAYWESPIDFVEIFPAIVEGKLRTFMNISRYDDGNPPVEDKFEISTDKGKIATVTLKYKLSD